MPLLAVDVQEHGGIAALLIVRKRYQAQPAVHFTMGFAGPADAGQIAFDVGGEHRRAEPGKALCQHLQGDRLAGAGSAGDQAVAVGRNAGLRDQQAVAATDHQLFVHTYSRSTGTGYRSRPVRSPMPAVMAMANALQKVTRAAPRITFAPAA